MQILKSVLAILIASAYILFFNASIKSGSGNIPAPGKFFNPFTGFWQNADADSELTEGEHSFVGIEDTITVIYDNRLVPHIFAHTVKDALYAQGYVTASLRLWQMDISTRASGGTLAEILGENLLERDLLQRRKGMLYAAEKIAEEWKKGELIQFLDAYCAGVNAYIETLSPAEYPIEFKLLGYEPEKWNILKIALFYKSMEETLNSREDDLEATNALKIFGEATFNYLFPERNPKIDPVIPRGTNWNFDTLMLSGLDTAQTSENFLYPRLPFAKADKDLGSNNWAVSGSKTRNGYPILCNDPHLNLTLPSIWFENQIHTPLFNCYGVSFPGVPGIVIGFNENVAWGATNGSHDVKDWYRIDWVDEAHLSYMLDGQPVQVEKRAEVIYVKGFDKPVTDTVRYTKWGPVVYEDLNSPYEGLAMRWIAHDAGSDFIWRTFWLFNEAKTYEDYLAATTYYGHPIQNFVFASKSGDIAIKVTGQLPIKQKEQGRFVQDGSLSKNAWQDWIPTEQMPVSHNPERGFVSSANQVSTDSLYPYYYNGVFNDYRGRIINRRLEEMDNITVEDMMRLQTDNYSIEAEELLPVLLYYLDSTRLSPIQDGLRKMLLEWNFRFDQDLAAPALYNEWKDAFRKMVWDEMYGLDTIPVLVPETWRTIELLNKDPLNVFFDIQSTPERETPADIATLSFIGVTDQLTEQLNDPEFNWSKHKALEINHIARIGPFSRKDITIGGHPEVINATRKSTGPSWRMVVELGEEVKGWGIYPGGQSGHPASQFYDNMIDKWSKGNYEELFFMKNKEDQRQPIFKTFVMQP